MPLRNIKSFTQFFQKTADPSRVREIVAENRKAVQENRFQNRKIPCIVPNETLVQFTVPFYDRFPGLSSKAKGLRPAECVAHKAKP